MPTPERTSQRRIVEAARALTESGGLDAVTMQAIADRVGVRAPSLYKRVRNRDHLLALVVDEVALELSGLLDAAIAEAPDADVVAILARTLRAYAHAHPEAYSALFVSSAGRSLSPEARTLSSRALLEVAERRVGAERALPAARTLTAWVTGFIGMELSGGFQLGGDVDAAFDYGIEVLSKALS